MAIDIGPRLRSGVAAAAVMSLSGCFNASLFNDEAVQGRMSTKEFMQMISETAHRQEQEKVRNGQCVVKSKMIMSMTGSSSSYKDYECD